ncbi:MAG: hydrogenase expression/formation C-terminal domain-containing protein, partial [Alphaproteobacteria bacterium]
GRGRSREVRPDMTAGPAVLAMLTAFAVGLKAAAATGRAWRRRVDTLSASDRAILYDALGEGEVSMAIAGGAPGEGTVQIHEAVLPGVWIGRAEDDQGTVRAEWVEVGDAPRVLREVAESRPRADIAIDALAPPLGSMNVMNVLSEVRSRATAWQPDGAPNHVMNFTLLPMSPVDTAFLAKVLGETGVRISSGGYGTARVIMTALKHVWAVQYLNGIGTTILDTIEIGDIPDAILASREDFEDSAARLDEIGEVYLQ